MSSLDALAYHTAKSNGLQELAEEILEETGLTEDDIPQAGPSSAPGSLAPPPIVTSQAESNWPTKSMGESYFDKALAAAAADPTADVAYTNGHSASAEKEDAWADESDEDLIGDGDEAGRQGQAGSRDEQQATRRTHGISPKPQSPMARRYLE